MTEMTAFEAVQKGLMMFVFVFLVLLVLYLLIMLQSRVIRAMQGSKAQKGETGTQAAAPVAAAPAAGPAPTGEWGGEVKLKDVDDQTAAMVMAIASDGSGIPLSELCFKSIALVQPTQNKQEEA